MSTEALNNIGAKEGEEGMLVNLNPCGLELEEEDELPAHKHLAHFGVWPADFSADELEKMRPKRGTK